MNVENRYRYMGISLFDTAQHVVSNTTVYLVLYCISIVFYKGLIYIDDIFDEHSRSKSVVLPCLVRRISDFFGLSAKMNA